MQNIIENIIRSKTLRPVNKITFTGSVCKIEFNDGVNLQQNISPSFLLEISLWLGHNIVLAMTSKEMGYVNRFGHKVCITNSPQQWQDLALLGARKGDNIIVNNELLIIL